MLQLQLLLTYRLSKRKLEDADQNKIWNERLNDVQNQLILLKHEVLILKNYLKSSLKPLFLEGVSISVLSIHFSA